MGDAFNDIGASLSKSIDGKGKSKSALVESEAGTGGGDGKAGNSFDIPDSGEMMETPLDQTRVTKETLKARMLELQEDFKRLEEEELQESPAQAVKKRKRRKPSGKGNGK